ncbi:MAG: hypothetical protein WED04_11380 [Promethearchaeati archaeon SRVP18_Atabeyarchaeia-1]
MNVWLKHVVVLTLGLLVYYAVTYLVVYISITTPSVAAAIISAGESPIGQVNTTIASLFPVPFVLWAIGVLMSKWVPF